MVVVLLSVVGVVSWWPVTRDAGWKVPPICSYEPAKVTLASFH